MPDASSTTSLEAAAIQRIHAIAWLNDLDLAIAQAGRIASEEEERRVAAESKAANCLLLVVALIPLIIAVLSAASDQSNPLAAPGWIVFPVLITAAVYLTVAGHWALRTIGVGNYHRVGIEDLTDIWATPIGAKRKLLRQILTCVRRNQVQMNAKVSYFSMSNKFVVRALYSFATLLIIELLFRMQSLFIAAAGSISV